jgi:hypothetical protein
LDKPNSKPYLPEDLDYEQVITEYLKEIGKLIEETLEHYWSNLVFFDNVLIIMPVLKYFHDLIKKNKYL